MVLLVNYPKVVKKAIAIAIGDLHDFVDHGIKGRDKVGDPIVQGVI